MSALSAFEQVELQEKVRELEAKLAASEEARKTAEADFREISLKYSELVQESQSNRDLFLVERERAEAAEQREQMLREALIELSCQYHQMGYEDALLFRSYEVINAHVFLSQAISYFARRSHDTRRDD